MKLTILTPTYNRIEKLYTLYKSLCNQTNKEFIWYIIDDGSTEEVEKIIKEFIEKKQMIIKFAKKKNGGKHTALNYAIKKIETDLVFIVDNDDWLTEDAVEKILKIHEKYENRNDICGYSFLRKYPNGKINNKKFPRNELIGNYIDVRINNNIGGDKAEVFFAKCLREYPFPEYDNEKFLGEDIVWIDMALKYDMVHINKAIYISEYLDDGLTKNRRKNNINSPRGCFERAKRLMYKECNLKTRLKGLLLYIIYGKFLRKNFKELWSESTIRNLGFVLVYPVGISIYYIWENKYQ